MGKEHPFWPGPKVHCRGPPGSLGLGMDVGQLLVFGIDIDDLYLINDPVSTGKHSGAMIRLGYFTRKKVLD